MVRVQIELSKEQTELIQQLKQQTGIESIASLLDLALAALGREPSVIHTSDGLITQNRLRLEDLATEIAAVQSETSQPQLFLCHSHRDKPFVRKLARDLVRLAVDVWFDEWELKPGDSLHGCIGTALRTSSFMGIVLSPNSVNSHWCQAELRESLAKEKRAGKNLVVPLLYKKVVAPPFLEDRLYLDFHRSYFSALAKLAALIHKIDLRHMGEPVFSSRLRNLNEVEVVLKTCGWKSERPVKAGDYDRICQILQRAGVPALGQRFSIVSKSSELDRFITTNVVR